MFNSYNAISDWIIIRSCSALPVSISRPDEMFILWVHFTKMCPTKFKCDGNFILRYPCSNEPIDINFTFSMTAVLPQHVLKFVAMPWPDKYSQTIFSSNLNCNGKGIGGTGPCTIIHQWHQKHITEFQRCGGILNITRILCGRYFYG